jgi:quinol monooxygenase YgiN
MAKVIFSIQYDINPEKRNEYLDIIRELKNLVKSEGLESYSVFEQKTKKNRFEEIHIFNSKEAYEDFDDNGDERIEILMDKLSHIIVNNSTHYNTLFEV